MSTAENFIPQDAELEINPAYYLDNVKNFADNEDIAGQIVQSVSEYNNRFISQRAAFAQEDRGIWNMADAAWRSWVNNSASQSEKKFGANEPDSW